MVRKTTKSKKAKSPRASKVATADASEEGGIEEQPKGEAEQAHESGTAAALGKRALIDRVVASSGIKKKAAKPVIEAVLKELGDAVSRGETLNLQPFGKANVKRKKDLEHAEIIELRLRRSKLAIKAAEEAAKADAETPVVPLDPLAEAAE